MVLLVALHLLLLTIVVTTPDVGPLGAATDCAMRSLLLDYAQTIQPRLSAKQRRAIFDSLELHLRCNRTAPPFRPALHNYPPASVAEALVVDWTHGDDGAAGTLVQPLKTVERALSLIAAQPPQRARAIALREGVHHLSRTLQLTPAHSHLRLGAYCSGEAPCETAWISGGVPLAGDDDLQWERASPSANIWKASIASSAASRAGTRPMASLHWLEDRDDATALTLARWPNRRPNDGTLDRPSLLDVMTGTDASWERAPMVRQATTVVEQHAAFSIPRNVSRYANHWVMGVGGECSRFDPPAGFICANASGGGYAWDDAGPFFPSALHLNNASALFPNIERWGRNLSLATITSWTNGWYTSTIPLAAAQSTTPGELSFDTAAWSPQGGRGWHFDLSDGPGRLCTGDVRTTDCGPLKIEGILAELDAPDEFCFDPIAAASGGATLYLYYNSTAGNIIKPPSSRTLVVPALRVLLAIRGAYSNGAHPASQPPALAVKNVTIERIGFRDSATSVMSPHGIPSGGDWSLQRSAALFLEGTEDVRFTECSFKYLGGIGYMVSGYNRRAVVEDSEFSYIGGSAIAAWGYTAPRKGSAMAARTPAGIGPDGTNGNHPLRTTVRRNVCRAIGLVEKQSSCFFQAKTGASIVEENLFYNLPRAAININDHFSGNTSIRRNALWNTCRESGDHGAINTWDRLPYRTVNASGEASVFPAYSNIKHNFIISNYNSFDGVDNDDGSSYYEISKNLFYDGEGMKSDYRGHSKLYHDNLHVGVGVCCFQFGFITCPDKSWLKPCAEAQNDLSNQFYQPGYTDHCFNNICVQRPGGSWIHGAHVIAWGCNATEMNCHPPGEFAVLNVTNNTVYKETGRRCSFGVANASCDIACGAGSGAVNMLSAAEFAAQCAEPPSVPDRVVEGVPSAAELSAWARTLLFPTQ